MDKKRNYWKLATFIFATVILLVIVTQITMNIQAEKQLQKDMKNVGGVRITQETMDEIIELKKDSNTFQVCNIEDNKCVTLTRIKK